MTAADTLQKADGRPTFLPPYFKGQGRATVFQNQPYIKVLIVFTCGEVRACRSTSRFFFLLLRTKGFLRLFALQMPKMFKAKVFRMKI